MCLLARGVVRGCLDSWGVLLGVYWGLILLIFITLKKMKRSGALIYLKVVTVLNIVVCGVVGGSALLFSNVGWGNDDLNTDVHSTSFAVYWVNDSATSPLFYRIGYSTYCVYLRSRHDALALCGRSPCVTKSTMQCRCSLCLTICSAFIVRGLNSKKRHFGRILGWEKVAQRGFLLGIAFENAQNHIFCLRELLSFSKLCASFN